MWQRDALSALRAISAGQAGLVTAAQAGAVGLDGAQRARLVRAGLLEAVDRGVYWLTADTLPRHLEIRIAWLRLDPATTAGERDGLGANDGVVSHRSACVVHELGDIPAPVVELTVPRRRGVAMPYLRLRVRSGLSAHEVTVVDGLPVTTVARTVIDLMRDSADGGHVGGVIADAERRGLIDLEQLAPAAARLAARYAMPGSDGLDLLDALVAQSVPT